MADAIPLTRASASMAAGSAEGKVAQNGQLEQQQLQRAEKPSTFQLFMKLGILWVSFMFFSRQFQKSKVEDALKVMNESEQDEASRILKPLPDAEAGEPNWIKQTLGFQSSEIPVFPEYDARGRQLLVHKCTFDKGQKMDLHVYMTDSEDYSTLWEAEGKVSDAATLLWHEPGLVFSAEAADVTRRKNMTLDLPPALLEDGSTWAHILLTKKGLSPNPKDPNYSEGGVSHQTAQLNKFHPKPKKKDVHYLVDSDKKKDKDKEEENDQNQDQELEDQEEGQMANFWKPTLHLGQVTFTSVFQRNHIPGTFADHITFQPSTGNYHPIIYVNEFWLQQRHLVPLNSTVERVELELSIAPIGFWKFQTMSQIESQWKAQSKLGLAAENEQDTMRAMFAETSPIVLVITMIVSLLHSVFNFLAFKNDITFWRNRKRSLEGISVRGMVVNLFFQTVILLYLFDNDTTYMILISNAIGLAIEMWKVGKFVVGRLDWGEVGGRPRRTIPSITFRATETYRKSKTKEFDDIAVSHLMYLIAPLMVGYAAYSLMHHQHKGWYSWVLNSLVGFVYMFGFVNMTPQLFINYKLKSVAHMPWRVMTYKSINTFIDDLFAFIIPMPTMHRLACFRDDIIFFVFLYQRYLYPVDKSRRNEFGQLAEDTEKIRQAEASIEPRAARIPRRPKTSVFSSS